MVSESIIDYAAQQIKRSQKAAFSCHYKKFDSDAEPAISEAERHRLVKGTKSPTRPKICIEARIFQNLSLEKPWDWNLPKYIDKPEVFARDCKGPGRYTVIGKREWSDEYRIRTEVIGVSRQAPPDNTGDRVTKILTCRGARKIAESCEFMHLKRGGYTTFLTLTLDQKARARVENGETTIQSEVSRFFDGLQKMYQRGFDCEINGEVKSLPGSSVMNGKSERLDYLWVAESPDNIDNDTGEITGTNPHVHVLMRYRVPYAYFEAWSKRIESLWGQGFAHLEKIKDGEKAGSYMAKAAGYLCKAQGKEDQGEIRGNRYNISKSARAPDWVCIGRYELGKMGFLLSEASDNFEDKFGHIQKRRDHLKKKLNKATGPDRHKIGGLLEKTRRTLKKMPRLSKYQAILKGDKQFNEFMHWASNDSPVENHSWLPDKGLNEGFIEQSGHGQWLNEFTARRAYRKERRKWDTWFSVQDCYMTSLYSGVQRGDIQIHEEVTEDSGAYWDYAQAADQVEFSPSLFNSSYDFTS